MKNKQSMNAAAKPTAAHTRELVRVAYVRGMLVTTTGKGIPINARVIAAIPDGVDGARAAGMWNETLAERDALRAELETCDKHIRMLREDSDMLRAEVATLREILGEIDTHAVTVQNCLNATRRISANRASAYREIDAICYKARAALGGGK